MIKRTIKYHCHYTGKYRGAAHNICNLRYKVPKEITIVFHNGSTYEYVDDWERFNKTSLPSKKDLYSDLIWRILMI